MFKKIRVKKSLGQNFLVNKSKLRKIADSLDLKKGDTVVEIGPGHGELTEQIIGELDNLGIRNYKLILIEKDRELAELLKEKFLGNKNIQIVEGDALKVLPKLTTNNKQLTTKYKIVGNIPYYITGHLLRVAGELKNKPTFILLTIQKEVAKRIAVRPPEMNLLAASVQFWAKPKITEYISKKDFKPAPKVDSAVIKLQTTNNKQQTDSGNYYKFIKILFKQPRKTIANNLSALAKKDEIAKILAENGISPADRPQNLDIGHLKSLSAKLIT